MKYQGIVNWLQEDSWCIVGFTSRGEAAVMEKETGVEVSDLPTFLIASILPTAKRKVVHQLRKQGHEAIQFQEVCYADRCECHIVVATTEVAAIGRGETLEQATVHAIENFIQKKQEKFQWTNLTTSNPQAKISENLKQDQ